jgi:hypothetical protein
MTFSVKHMAAVVMVATGLVGGFWACRAVTYHIRGAAVYWEPVGDNPQSHIVTREDSADDFNRVVRLTWGVSAFWFGVALIGLIGYRRAARSEYEM